MEIKLNFAVLTQPITSLNCDRLGQKLRLGNKAVSKISGHSKALKPADHGFENSALAG